VNRYQIQRESEKKERKIKLNSQIEKKTEEKWKGEKVNQIGRVRKGNRETEIESDKERQRENGK
jgi:hypothetical protein